MDCSFIYVTASSRDEALALGRALVEQRLAACVNVLDGMTSVYRWNDAVQQESEAVLIVKTRSALVDTVIETVRALHSYECPCVAAWPIAAGSPPYLDWIARETEAGEGGKRDRGIEG